MASIADSRRLGLGFVAVLTTAFLVWFGTGLSPSWPLMWFAPLPVLLFARSASWWAAAAVAALGWCLGFFNMWPYFHAVIKMPLTVLAPIYGGATLAFVLTVLLYRTLLRRGAYWSATLAFPALWVSFEYLTQLGSPHGTAGNLAYSQLTFLPFLQLASLTGLWGMSFLLLLFSSAIATGLHLRIVAPQRALRIAGSCLGTIALVLVFGAVRLAMPESGPTVKAGLVAWDRSGEPPLADEGAPTTQLIQAYAEQAAALAAQGARIVVMPEKLGIMADADIPSFDTPLQAVADKTGTDLVVGLIRLSSGKAYNEARLYSPGRAVRSYDKHHMLPPFESKLEPGTTLTLLPQSAATWGMQICKDMDFTALSRDYGKAGAGLMLVPAWDFDLDRLWHGHLAVMRGVEDGFSVVRAAKQGYLTVSDNRGRILAEADSGATHFASLLADVPTTHATTVYLLLGDWFAWLVLAILAWTLANCFRRRAAA